MTAARPTPGNFRLLKQGGGKTAFAHVFVEVIPLTSGSTSEVVWSVDPDDHDSAHPKHDPDECEAAVLGARAFVHEMEDPSGREDPVEVRIKRVVISLVDSTPDAVRTASAAATAVALGTIDCFEVVHEGTWQLKPLYRR